MTPVILSLFAFIGGSVAVSLIFISVGVWNIVFELRRMK